MFRHTSIVMSFSLIKHFSCDVTVLSVCLCKRESQTSLWYCNFSPKSWPWPWQGHFNSEFQETAFNVILIYGSRLTKGCYTPQCALVKNAYTWMKNFRILIELSLKFVPKGPIDDKLSLVQVMAWRLIGDKPLPEPMMTQFTDAYIHLLASMI